MLHVTVTAINTMQPAFAPEGKVPLEKGSVKKIVADFDKAQVLYGAKSGGRGDVAEKGAELADNGNNRSSMEIGAELADGFDDSCNNVHVTAGFECIGGGNKRKRSVTFELGNENKPIVQERNKPIGTIWSFMLKKPITSTDQKIFDAITLYPRDGFPFVEIYGYNIAKLILEHAILGKHGLRRCLRMFRHYSSNRNILLYGKDVGILKQIAICVAKRINIPFIVVKGSKLDSKYRAESSNMVEKTFHLVACDEPCILYIEDADLMIGSGKDASTRDVKVQFCIQLDYSRVFNRATFVIVATNKPWEINHKLMSRFDEMLFVDCIGRPYGRNMRAFRMNNDPKYDAEKENYYSLMDAFPCLGI